MFHVHVQHRMQPARVLIITSSAADLTGTVAGCMAESVAGGNPPHAALLQPAPHLTQLRCSAQLVHCSHATQATAPGGWFAAAAPATPLQGWGVRWCAVQKWMQQNWATSAGGQAAPQPPAWGCCAGQIPTHHNSMAQQHTKGRNHR
ncbi:hypothetical protein COO60DRAFT_1480711 [Scenedesmus sp. NREL 46B-D3]|nr:hypothetical protein COO60DRAFT_1480711 [Scenedesmus sp. NREL 46B-D3]